MQHLGGGLAPPRKDPRVLSNYQTYTNFHNSLIRGRLRIHAR